MAAAPNKRKRPTTWNDLAPDVKRHITTMVIKDAMETSSLIAREHGVLEDERGELLKLFLPDLNYTHRDYWPKSSVVRITANPMQTVHWAREDNRVKREELIHLMKQFKNDMFCITRMLLGMMPLSNKPDVREESLANLRVLNLVCRLNG